MAAGNNSPDPFANPRRDLPPFKVLPLSGIPFGKTLILLS
jgi:hypothetical protein